MSQRGEAPDVRLKRLGMRSARRGMREMDLILGSFARRGLPLLGEDALDAYEMLLDEPDQEILDWITGRAAPPPAYAGLVEALRSEKIVDGL
ncbi:MAG: succinate dehydrogenase assembly factor 2 [Pseudomonadota bacterium]